MLVGIKRKPYTTVSTITEKGLAGLVCFKGCVFRIESKMKIKITICRSVSVVTLIKRGRPSDWEYKKITYGFPEVFEDNPYIFYGESDTGGYLWNVKLQSLTSCLILLILDAEGIAAIERCGFEY